MTCDIFSGKKNDMLNFVKKAHEEMVAPLTQQEKIECGTFRCKISANWHVLHHLFVNLSRNRSWRTNFCTTSE